MGFIVYKHYTEKYEDSFAVFISYLLIIFKSRLTNIYHTYLIHLIIYSIENNFDFEILMTLIFFEAYYQRIILTNIRFLAKWLRVLNSTGTYMYIGHLPQSAPHSCCMLISPSISLFAESSWHSYTCVDLRG